MGGRDSGTKLRVDPRKFAQRKLGIIDCRTQLSQLLECLEREGFEEKHGDCAVQYAELAECSAAYRAALKARKGPVSSINFHLARIAKLML
jgi:hypothetical protein